MVIEPKQLNAILMGYSIQVEWEVDQLDEDIVLILIIPHLCYPLGLFAYFCAHKQNLEYLAILWMKTNVFACEFDRAYDGRVAYC